MVVLDHGGKHHSLYAHLVETSVQMGQKVATGDILGTVGATSVEGSGLYFEMRFQGRPADPLDWLRRPDRADRSDP
jgi:septal ring factor EnvC (AmiA/AmiB activator)